MEQNKVNQNSAGSGRFIFLTSLLHKIKLFQYRQSICVTTPGKSGISGNKLRGRHHCGEFKKIDKEVR